MVSHDGVVRESYESQLPRMAGTVAAVWQLAALVPVLIYARDYRQPLVPLAVWLGLLATAAWLIPRARASGRVTGAEAAAAVGIAIAAVAVVGWDRRTHGATGSVDWSVFGTAWLLALVALSRPAWEWVCGAVGVFTAHAIFVIRVLGPTPLGLARLAAAAFILVTVLVIFAALRPTMHTQASMAARHAALASRSAAERAAAAAVREDRRRRLALLEADALPLLRAIADGTLDPADGQVRERCARHAAALRRALADQAHAGSGLLAGLEPALLAAQARGVPVEVQVVGDPGQPGPEVSRAALAVVDGLLAALPPHPVLLTVLASGSETELYVTFDRPPRVTPDPGALGRALPAVARWQATVDVSDTGAGCLEVRWRNAAALDQTYREALRP
jgi:hypothetical protein